MARYAILDENNFVINIIVGREPGELVNGVSDWETYYGVHLNKMCKVTSYPNWAVIGGIYDTVNNVFISPQPFPSWIRSGSFWEAPTPRPEDDKFYTWDEDSLSWIEQTQP